MRTWSHLDLFVSSTDRIYTQVYLSTFETEIMVKRLEPFGILQILKLVQRFDPILILECHDIYFFLLPRGQ